MTFRVGVRSSVPRPASWLGLRQSLWLKLAGPQWHPEWQTPGPSQFCCNCDSWQWYDFDLWFKVARATCCLPWPLDQWACSRSYLQVDLAGSGWVAAGELARHCQQQVGLRGQSAWIRGYLGPSGALLLTYTYTCLLQWQCYLCLICWACTTLNAASLNSDIVIHFEFVVVYTSIGAFAC